MVDLNAPNQQEDGESTQSSNRYEKIEPRDYQIKIKEAIKAHWEKENDYKNPGRQIGNIVYLDTGTGKTYIAVMLLKHLFGEEDKPDLALVPLSEDDKRAKQDLRQEAIRNKDVGQSGSSGRKMIRYRKAVFIVPTQNLVEQQATTIDTYTNLIVGRYHGGIKGKKAWNDYESWRAEFEQRDVFVAMAKKFYDLLMHGFIKIDEIDLIVFDECHHTDQEHLYNLIMKDFFFHKFNPMDPAQRRPKIIGLTASPIKQKIERQKVIADDIEVLLQNLSNNLYSRFITISQEKINQLEKDLVMQIEKYDSDLQGNVAQVYHIEEGLIKQLANLVPLPKDAYQVDPQQELVEYIQNSARKIAVEEHDTQVIKFLNGRKALISLDNSVTRSQIDIGSFENYEDQVLILMSIIMLKNINNLLIEVGYLAVKAFFTDIKQDLLVFNKDQSKLGNKRDTTVSIIDNFCSQKTESAQRISPKVQKLVDILKESYSENKKLKTIIFVKDRSVAVYLKKILTGSLYMRSKDGENPAYPDDSFLGEALLDPEVFRLGFAMGFQSKNLVNKAYRATNSTNVDYFKDVMAEMPSCGSVRLSQNELKKTLEGFRTGQINVLIATNVVEEGLDVSTCNQVICLNELFTVKAFIQMKGRARQDNSKFIFLCANEEYEQVKEDQESFSRVISFMKQITMRSLSRELLPGEDIIAVKQVEEASYLEIEETRAKITMRDAKHLIEQFCQEAAEKKMIIEQTKATEQFEKLSLEDPEKEEGKMEVDSDKASKKNVNRLELKPNYVIQEKIHTNGNKFYYASLYMPESCCNYLNKVRPLSAFLKKKDAENHVALLAVKNLHDVGFIDHNLFPANVVLPEDIKLYKEKHKQRLAAAMNQGEYVKPRKVKQFTDEQIKAQRQEQKDFLINLKTDKKQVEFEQTQNLVNKNVFSCNFEDLLVHTFRGISPDDNYPYKNCKDYLGILFNRQFHNPQLRFTMYQENKQMLKNEEHLCNLVSFALLDPKVKEKISQMEECLQVMISETDSFKIGDDIKQENMANGKDETPLEFLKKVQFYHFWIFYFVYSADHKFLKAIFKKKFGFVEPIFGKDINFIREKYGDSVEAIYGPKAAGRGPNKSKPIHTGDALLAYTVPVTHRRDGKGLTVNWSCINRIIEFTRNRLYEIALTTERHVIVAKYDLEEWSKKDRILMVRRLWDQKSQGNRIVVLKEEPSQQMWYKPLDLNQSKKEKAFDKPELANGIKRCLNHVRGLPQNPFESQYIPKNTITFTTQEFYYIKQGMLQSRRFNKQIVQCRKERHFFDFGKKRREELEDQKISGLTAKQIKYNQGLRNLAAQRKVNTMFDITDQMLSLAPVTYNQYQVMQQACFHILNFNEFLIIENFIMTMFEGLTCLIDASNPDTPSPIATDVLRPTIGIVADETAQGRGDRFIHKNACEQLLLRMDLVKEALTAPGACREYDYERLEFYGDSIIGFLVILELYLTKPEMQEGDLDHMRIQRVSNMRFFKVNKEFGFHRFMITDAHNVYSGFLPVGFGQDNEQERDLSYQTKVTQKNFNEMNNKYKELKKIEQRVKYMKPEDDSVKQLFMQGECYSLVKMILKDKDLVDSLKEEMVPQLDQYGRHPLDEFEGKTDIDSVLAACKLVYASSSINNPDQLVSAKEVLMSTVRSCLEKVQRQLAKAKEQRDNKSRKQRSALAKKRQFFFKQLADVVESVTGAATMACGLNLTQSYLLKIGVIKEPQEVLDSQLNKFTTKQLDMEPKLIEKFYKPFNMERVEKILGYSFKCKSWIVEALTHKSSIDTSVESSVNMRLQDYERLEFLGDSVLNYLVAKNFFLTTMHDEVKKMPKELHKMKTSVINNALLSLILIEMDIHPHIIFNKKATSFKIQFDEYVETVQAMVKESGCTRDLWAQMQKDREIKKKLAEEAALQLEQTELNLEAPEFKPEEHKMEVDENPGQKRCEPFDVDNLYEHNLKIFGDVFESLIGAIFLDSRSIDKTWSVLKELIEPYIKVYADLETLQDHSRTKLLELWNQKIYTKFLKCSHQSQQLNEGNQIRLSGVVSNIRLPNDLVIFEEVFPKEAKNKIRSFYKKFFTMVEAFCEGIDAQSEDYAKALADDPPEAIRRLIEFSTKWKATQQQTDDQVNKEEEPVEASVSKD